MPSPTTDVDKSLLCEGLSAAIAALVSIEQLLDKIDVAEAQPKHDLTLVKGGDDA